MPSNSPPTAVGLVEVRSSRRHGRGVFARTAIGAGDVVERCPVLLIDPTEAEQIASGSLSGYVYDWGDGHVAVALGFGSLYNHDPAPNAHYSQSDDGSELVVVTLRPVAAGEELTIDYSGGGEVPLWFSPSGDD